MDLKERIQELCRHTGKSMNQVEIDLKFGKGYISKLGKSTPNAVKIQQIANYFNVTVDYLMTGKEESPEAKKPTLSESEELNVITDVDKIMDRIRNKETVVLRFNGEDYSGDEDEDKLLRDSLLSLCRAAIIKKKHDGFGE